MSAVCRAGLLCVQRLLGLLPHLRHAEYHGDRHVSSRQECSAEDTDGYGPSTQHSTHSADGVGQGPTLLHAGARGRSSGAAWASIM